jgi:hypothetical protein
MGFPQLSQHFPLTSSRTPRMKRRITSPYQLLAPVQWGDEFAPALTSSARTIPQHLSNENRSDDLSSKQALRQGRITLVRLNHLGSGGVVVLPDLSLASTRLLTLFSNFKSSLISPAL